MAQAAHGCAPDIAGRGIANPVGMLLSGALLLRWLGGRPGTEAYGPAGDLLERAVLATLAAGRGTRDLRGEDDTASFGLAVLDAVAQQKA
jgi:3-isopropylmalate dehydrogenase